jgi:hypothetical protein
MRKTTRLPGQKFILAMLLVFIILLAIYIPLKLYIAQTESEPADRLDGLELSIFVTADLAGYREPSG